MNMSEVLSKDISIWTQLDAVKNGRVHYLDKQRFHFKPNEKWAEAYDYITELLINN